MQAGRVAHARGRRQTGFAYLLVLFALAAIGVVLSGAGQLWHAAAQREKEAQLLFAGNQFRQALISYHNTSPGAVKHYPLRLEDLLEDRRHPVPLRHLRRIYPDPMTGGDTWGLVLAGGRIVGVYSQHTGRPFKSVFRARDAAFAAASRYDQWVFGNDGVAAAPVMPRSPGPEPVPDAGRDAR